MANSTSCTYINYQYQAYTCIVLWYFPENVQSFYLVCFIFLSAIWSIGPALQLQLILLHQICLSLSFNMLCMRLQTWVATAPCLFFKILLVVYLNAAPQKRIWGQLKPILPNYRYWNFNWFPE